MKPLFRPLLEWLGYSRRERRASLILIILIVIVYLIRYAIPRNQEDFEVISSFTYRTGRDIIAEAPVLHKGGMVSIQKRSSRIELNSCDSAELERLPGIGPVLSARIIKFRNILGGFASVDQLREVYGLRDSVYQLISGRLTADTALLRKININAASFTDLNRHPYLDSYDAGAIIRYRKAMGRINSISDLVENRILTAEKAGRISPYLAYD